MSDQFAVVNDESVLSWVLGVPSLVDVEVAITLDDVAIDESPVAATEHPTLAGVYQAEVTFTEAGTYGLVWSGDGGGETQEDALYVVEELTDTQRVNARVMDSGLRMPMSSVLVRFMHYDKTEGGYVLDDEVTTDATGYVTTSLGAGDYVAVIEKSGYSFGDNNFFFTVYDDSLVTPLLFNMVFVEVPASGYTPPTSLVTMSVSLIGIDGNPLRYRDVAVTSRGLSTYESGATFVVGESSFYLKTDSNGVASVTLVPGAEIEVSVAGTRLTRRITVPVTNFDLSGYVSGAGDYFNVISMPYAATETP